MKVNYKPDPNSTFEVEVPSINDAFQFLSQCDTVFGVRECGNCSSPHLKRKFVRTPEGYEYYSVVCQDCRHELKFGQAKEDNRLFPKGWEPPYQKDNAQGGERGADSTRQQSTSNGAAPRRTAAAW